MLLRPRRRRGYHRPRYYRPRRRTNVRVGGCCLPIPLGVLAAGAVGTRMALGRRGR